VSNENGKLLNIVTDIQADVRETRGDVKKIIRKVAEHEIAIDSAKRSVGWVYRIIGGIVVAVMVALIVGG
jgi:hypothetical protein